MSTAAATTKPEVFLKSLEVTTSDAENTDRLHRLAVVDKKIQDIEAEKATEVSKHNENLKQYRKEQRKLLDAIQSRKQQRDEQVDQVPDYRLGKMNIDRASDTCFDEERALTDEERERELPCNNGAKGAAAANDDEAGKA